MATAELCLSGTFRLTEPNGPPRTKGRFGQFIHANADVLRHYFHYDLFEGSLNVTVDDPNDIHDRLDMRQVTPAFVIPRDQLRDMPHDIGDAQVWRIVLLSPKMQDRPPCWLFRRVGSQVPRRDLEVISPIGLVQQYGLRNDDPVSLIIFPK